jgi:hypothetical protein
MKPRLFPFADRDFSDFTMEKGHEKPKQHSIRNSNIPISKLHYFTKSPLRQGVFATTARQQPDNAFPG